MIKNTDYKGCGLFFVKQMIFNPNPVPENFKISSSIMEGY